MTGGAQDSGAITRTMEREFWNGVPVVAYHWTIHDPECPIEGLRERPGIAYHWSTGPEDAARLISVADVEEYLSRATHAPAGLSEQQATELWNVCKNAAEMGDREVVRVIMNYTSTAPAEGGV